MISTLFREMLTGTVPNMQNLRLDARGSACDDPRINTALYDFDANEMLQSINYVWDRPARPAPAPDLQWTRYAAVALPLAATAAVARAAAG